MKRFLYLIPMLAVSLAMGCAMLRPADPADVLKARSTAFWQAKTDGNWEGAYAFHCRAFKQKLSRTNYIKSANVTTKNFEVAGAVVAENGTSATVTVLADIEFNGMQIKKVPMKEPWVLEDGDWFICPPAGGFLDLFKKK